MLPPLVVVMIVPSSPQAQPLFASKKKMLRRVLVVPDTCVDQVMPPSIVFNMVPDSPAAHPVDRSMNLMAFSCSVTGSPLMGVQIWAWMCICSARKRSDRTSVGRLADFNDRKAGSFCIQEG